MALVAASLAFAAPTASANENGGGGAKIGICHHNNGAREYTLNDVSVNSVGRGQYAIDWNGHGNHADDIVPLIKDPNGKVLFPGRGDQRILSNGCRVPEPTCADGGTWDKQWGKCTWKATAYDDAKGEFCSAKEGTIQLSVTHVEGSGTSHKSMKDAESEAAKSAHDNAEAALARLAHDKDVTEGACRPTPTCGDDGVWDPEHKRCTWKATAFDDAEGDFCSEESGTIHLSVTDVEGTGTSHKSLADAQSEAAWNAEHNAKHELRKLAEAQNVRPGKCEAPPIEYCADGSVVPEDGICPSTPPVTEFCADGVTLLADGCPSSEPTTFTMEASAGGSVDFCVAGTENVKVDYGGSGSGTSELSSGDAFYVANQNANAAAAEDLEAKTPANATEGACGVVSPAAVAVPEAATVPEEPVVVAAPEEATVPATVAVPEAATIPEAVPAGGGSSEKGGPNTGLLLLALVATGVCLFATGRVLATRSR